MPVFHDLDRMTRVNDNPDSLIHEQWRAAVRHRKRCIRPFWISKSVQYIPRLTPTQLRKKFRRLQHDFRCNYRPGKRKRYVITYEHSP